MSIELQSGKTEKEVKDASQNPGLKRTINTFGGSGVIVGSIIGSGIFISPGLLIKHLRSYGLALIFWAISGLISILGGLCFAELGTSIPKSGAEYNYIMDSAGNIMAFLFLWASVLIIKPAAVTIISLTAALYLGEAIFKGYIVPDYIVKLIAACIIILITLLNIVSVKWSIRINNVLNYMKIICILLIVAIGIYSATQGGIDHFKNPFKGSVLDAGAFGSAIASGLWSYDGWNNSNYLIEEMTDPTKNLPRSIIIGLSIVICCYISINIAYIAALGAKGVAQSDAVALTVANKFLGKAYFIVPILVAASATGAANAAMFSNGRLLFVAGREGHLPLIISALHNKFHTPVVSLVLTAIISLTFLIPSIDQLDKMITFFSFAVWIFFGLCFCAQIYFRFFRKDILKPYKVFIAIPFLMVIVSVTLVILPIVDNWKGPLIATAIIISGLPVYFLFIKFNRKLPLFFRKGINNFSEKIMKVYNLSPAKREEDLA